MKKGILGTILTIIGIVIFAFTYGGIFLILAYLTGL